MARAWGITPQLVQIAKGGSGMGGGSVAVGELFLENQIMIRPEQHDLEESINIFLKSLFGFDPKIKFKTIDTNNQKDMAIILAQIVNSGTKISQKDARNYIDSHGIMELTDPDTIPADDDCVTPVSTRVNIDGDSRLEGSVESDPDGIGEISEDKFND